MCGLSMHSPLTLSSFPAFSARVPRTHTQTHTQPRMVDPASAASPLSVLEAEKAHLEKAAAKLRASNAELKAALAVAAGEDAAELKLAFCENIPVIAKYTARAAALGEEIARCRRAAGMVEVEGESGAGAGASEPEQVEVEEEGVGGAPAPAAPPAPAAAAAPGPPGAADGVWL